MKLKIGQSAESVQRRNIAPIPIWMNPPCNPNLAQVVACNFKLPN